MNLLPLKLASWTGIPQPSVFPLTLFAHVRLGAHSPPAPRNPIDACRLRAIPEKFRRCQSATCHLRRQEQVFPRRLRALAREPSAANCEPPTKKDPVGPARVPTGSSGNREMSVPGHARQWPSIPRRTKSAGSAVRYQLFSLVVKACISRDGQIVRVVALGRQTAATGLLRFKTLLPVFQLWRRSISFWRRDGPPCGRSREALDFAAG